MPIDILVRVGRHLRYLRTSRGISQEDLASQAGLTQAALSRIETGNAEAGLRTLHDIAKALGLKMVDLLNGMD